MSDFASRSTRLPSTSYKRRYIISTHALERFRERVDEELRYRSDDDLSNLLDVRICHTAQRRQVRDPRAPEAITTLHAVQCRNDIYYAVERDKTVVTLLDETMALNNFGGQKSQVLNAPFATKLRDLKIEVAPPKPKSGPSALAIAPPAPSPVPELEVVTSTRDDEVAAAIVALQQAATALRQAATAVDEAHRRLINVTGKGK